MSLLERHERFTGDGTLIESDHQTCWVTTRTGNTIGRWSALTERMDVHTPDSTGCLECGPGSFFDFIQAMREHHGVYLWENDRPGSPLRA